MKPQRKSYAIELNVVHHLYANTVLWRILWVENQVSYIQLFLTN